MPGRILPKLNWDADTHSPKHLAPIGWRTELAAVEENLSSLGQTNYPDPRLTLGRNP